MSKIKTTDIYLYLGVAWPFENEVMAYMCEIESDEYVFLHKLEGVNVRIPDEAEIASAKIANLEKENRKLQAETQEKINNNNEKIKRLQALEYKQ